MGPTRLATVDDVPLPVIASPALTTPPALTTAITPALRMRCPYASRPRTPDSNPGSNASICLHGLRKPVISITASAPSRNCTPLGRARRSMPRVVTFSPMAPGRTPKPPTRNSSSNSSCTRCTCRRFGASESRARRWAPIIFASTCRVWSSSTCAANCTWRTGSQLS